MRRFLIAPEDISGDTFHLSGPEAEHAVKVLRLRAGEKLELMDGLGAVYEAVVDRVRHNREVFGTLKPLPASASGSTSNLRLYASLIKADRWEWLLEKAAELGAASIIPVFARRSVVELKDADRIEAKLERWRRILAAAAKQCQSDTVAGLESPLEFSQAMAAAAAAGPVLMAWEGLAGKDEGPGLRSIVENLKPGPISLFTGPEGGFTEDEVGYARSNGASLFSLGPRILRAETAALAAVALVGYELRQPL